VISPFAAQLKEIGIAQFADLSLWKPQLGDFVIYNGWFRHWFGLVVATQPGELDILHSVLPINVFTMGPNEAKQHTRKIDVSEVHRSRGGKYAVIQVSSGQTPIVFLR
jgi:hypothetical protein